MTVGWDESGEPAPDSKEHSDVQAARCCARAEQAGSGQPAGEDYAAAALAGGDRLADRGRPSPRNAEAVMAIARWLHPSAFGLPADGS